MNDPIVIDPPGFDQKASWGEHRDYVEKCGGPTHDDGEVNWRAAFGADPGVCSCPLCPKEYYWCFGRVQQCRKCGFHYPTDWWAMFSWGAQQRRRTFEQQERLSTIHNRHMAHKYYRWAFTNIVEPSMEAAHAVAWKTVFPEDVHEIPAGT